jgi:hypothetical protein
MASPVLPYKTFRIERLPLGFTVEELRLELKNAFTEPVQRSSLATVPSASHQTATVTMETQKDYKSFQNSRGQPRELDATMLGFTTLSYGAEPGLSVEYAPFLLPQTPTS